MLVLLFVSSQLSEQSNKAWLIARMRCLQPVIVKNEGWESADWYKQYQFQNTDHQRLCMKLSRSIQSSVKDMIEELVHYYFVYINRVSRCFMWSYSQL